MLLLAGVTPAAPLRAQSIERNLPPPPQLSPQAPETPPAETPETDASALGPPVRKIVLLGADDPLVSTAIDSVDLSRLGDTVPARLRGQLATRLGQPLSRALLSALRDDIVTAYRAAGRPFLTVIAPPQPIDDGILQLRVIVFRLGRTIITPSSETERIAPAVRARPGAELLGPPLAEDLAWLNRYPYRRVQSTLAPGADLGTTDLSLVVTRLKPWTLYGGYANGGTPRTGRARLFAGVQAALPWLPDGYASYQATGSRDALTDPGSPFRASHPLYVSHAARLGLAPSPRQAVEFATSYVHTNVTVRDFLVRQWTLETSALYRAALSNLIPGAIGTIAVGGEYKRQVSRTLFGETEASRVSQDIAQLHLSYSVEASGLRDSISFELAARISPGQVGARNDDENLTAFAFGARRHARYAYATGQGTLVHRFGRGWIVQSELYGQLAARRLPLTETFGIGGASQVRAFTLDDGSYDSGVVARVTLRPPTNVAFASGSFGPYVLADGAYAVSGGSASVFASGFGAGVDYRRGLLAIGGEAAIAASDAGRTRAGDVRVNVRLTQAF